MVVDALAHGGQIFILRKGGIHEGRGGFQMEHSEFLFFPTLFHQQREEVVDSAAQRFDQISKNFPPEGILRLQYWAKVVEWRRIESFDAVRALAGQHIWKEQTLAERFEWGREKGIFAIAVRVYRLPMAVELPMVPEYGGCKSWVSLAHSVALEPDPVLSEAAFSEAQSRLHSSLQ